ncbi:MAG TPA: SDR family NAD(P)-dependent oxidoreductase [Ignavibacteria bacterium]|nr:SDR family NAD(P)-dependent oxidoreductase [Ignavibacteria bacterium]
MQKERWNSTNIPGQEGKIVIVTGSSSGIGCEAVRVLANKKAKVILAVRNLGKGKAAEEKIRNQNPNVEIKIMLLDLADLHSVCDFAENFTCEFNKLHMLINNAGVMIPPYSKTKDGFELQVGTNHLGHFALTALLFDLIQTTPNSRIVNVSSTAHKYGNINFDDINWEKRNYKAWRAYGDSKIANLYFTYFLKFQLEKAGSNVKVTAAHPGWTATDLQRYSTTFRFLNKFFAQSLKMGALPILRAATDPEAQNGDYFGPSGWQEWHGYPVKVGPNKLSRDMGIAQKLWGVSEELTKIKFEIKGN